MPLVTQNRKPTSVWTSAAWSFSTSGLVADVTDANDATYDSDATVGEDLLFDCEDVAAPGAPGMPVTSCILNTRMWNPSAGADGQLLPRANIGGTYYSGTNRQPGAGYSNFTDSFTTQVTTTDLFNGAKFGAQSGNYTTNPLRLVEVSVDVTFIAPDGGFAFLIGQYLGPLVAVGLHEMPALLREIERLSRRRLRFLPGEGLTAWRELREASRRRFFFSHASGLYLEA